MSDSTSKHTRRSLLVAATVTAAFIGFLYGVRPAQPGADYTQPVAQQPSTAPAARSNAELVTNPWRTERMWNAAAVPARPPVTTRDQAASEAALAARLERRAFEGAPPTIPHPIAQASAVECRACHEHGALIGDRIAPAMSHPPYAMCTQCHVPEVAGLQARSQSPAALAENTFAGITRHPSAFVYSPGSPPQTPHRRFMRERCNACHGPAGRPGLQTSHPERPICEQCHTTTAVANQQPRGAP